MDKKLQIEIKNEEEAEKQFMNLGISENKIRILLDNSIYNMYTLII